MKRKRFPTCCIGLAAYPRHLYCLATETDQRAVRAQGLVYETQRIINPSHDVCTWGHVGNVRHVIGLNCNEIPCIQAFGEIRMQA
jgi:hypothetical protein